MIVRPTDRVSFLLVPPEQSITSAAVGTSIHGEVPLWYCEMVRNSSNESPYKIIQIVSVIPGLHFKIGHSLSCEKVPELDIMGLIA